MKSKLLPVWKFFLCGFTPHLKMKQIFVTNPRGVGFCLIQKDLKNTNSNQITPSKPFFTFCFISALFLGLVCELAMIQFLCSIKVLNQFSSFLNSPWAGSRSAVTNQRRLDLCVCADRRLNTPFYHHCCRKSIRAHAHMRAHTQLQALWDGFMHLWGAEQTFITPFIHVAPFLSKGHKNQFADLNLAKSFGGGALKPPPEGGFYDPCWVTVTIQQRFTQLCVYMKPQ